ncbi:MAG: PIN domain-containing protein [Pseudomonadota bacterium]
MSKIVLLIDYENAKSMEKVDLSKYPPGSCIRIFVGKLQKPPEMTAVGTARDKAMNVELIWIDEQGKNALDFHIAYYLGKTLSITPQAQCVILSDDKDYDPLIHHLTARGFSCRRDAITIPAEASVNTKHAGAISTAAVASARHVGATQVEKLKSVVDKLRDTPQKSRPRRRKTLESFIANNFQYEKWSGKEIIDLVDRVLKQGYVTETDKGLTYNASFK